MKPGVYFPNIIRQNSPISCENKNKGAKYTPRVKISRLFCLRFNCLVVWNLAENLQGSGVFGGSDAWNSLERIPQSNDRRKLLYAKRSSLWLLEETGRDNYVLYGRLGATSSCRRNIADKAINSNFDNSGEFSA